MRCHHVRNLEKNAYEEGAVLYRKLNDFLKLHHHLIFTSLRVQIKNLHAPSHKFPRIGIREIYGFVDGESHIFAANFFVCNFYSVLPWTFPQYIR